MSIQTKHHEPIVYKVYDFLKNYIGAENAIPAKDLTEALGISERTLRDCIAEIRNSTELTRIIGSSNKGYFLCRESEFDQANRRLERQAFSLLKVSYSNRKKAAKNGQFKIPLGEYYSEVFEAFGKEDSGN